MDRQRARCPRQVERHQPDPADGCQLETVGAVVTLRVPARPSGALRFAGEESRIGRDQEFPAHSDHQQHGRVLGTRLRAHQYWNEQLSKKSLEYRLDTSPPRAARAFTLPYVALYDVGIACWDGKYAYWAIRPFQLDPEVKTVVTTPNHPSYPAAHACTSIAMTKVLGYLFPRDAEIFAALGEQAAESRIWAGIHYRSDINAGRQLALAVADKIIARARLDGAQ